MKPNYYKQRLADFEQRLADTTTPINSWDLTNLRRILHMTQTQLGNLLLVSKPTIANWECNRYPVAKRYWGHLHRIIRSAPGVVKTHHRPDWAA